MKIRSGIFVPIIIVVLGISITTSVVFQIDRVEKRRVIAQLEMDLNRWVSLMQFAVDKEASLLISVVQTLENKHILTSDSFAEESKNTMQIHSDVIEVNWIPKLSHDERVRYETMKNAEDLPFIVRDYAPGSGFIPSPVRKIYHPIYYQQRRYSHGQSLGWDLEFVTSLRNVFSQIDKQKNDTVVTFLDLPQQDINIKQAASKLKMVFFSRLNAVVQLPDGSTRTEKGYIMLMSNASIIYSYLKSFLSYDKLQVRATSKQGEVVNVLLNPFTDSHSPLHKYSVEAVLKNHLVDGWTFTITPTQAYFDEISNNNSMWIISTGVLGTLLLTVYVISVSHRQYLVQHYVDQKTIELQLTNETLDRLSRTDYLTGVANRRLFDEVLELEWSRSVRQETPLTLIILDIDFFKQFNDHYGHVKGDECLRQVAKTLKAAVKRPGDLVARYGGEEFAILLTHTDEKAGALAEYCCSAIEALAIENRGSMVSQFVTISLGIVTVVPHGGQNAIDLLESADRALYQAKKQGRNCVVVKR